MKENTRLDEKIKYHKCKFKNCKTKMSDGSPVFCPQHSINKIKALIKRNLILAEIQNDLSNLPINTLDYIRTIINGEIDSRK